SPPANGYTTVFGRPAGTWARKNLVAGASHAFLYSSWAAVTRLQCSATISVLILASPFAHAPTIMSCRASSRSSAGSALARDPVAAIAAARTNQRIGGICHARPPGSSDRAAIERG